MCGSQGNYRLRQESGSQQTNAAINAQQIYHDIHRVYKEIGVQCLSGGTSVCFLLSASAPLFQCNPPNCFMNLWRRNYAWVPASHAASIDGRAWFSNWSIWSWDKPSAPGMGIRGQCLPQKFLLPQILLFPEKIFWTFNKTNILSP